jgi:hypothetical protein
VSCRSDLHFHFPERFKDCSIILPTQKCRVDFDSYERVKLTFGEEIGFAISVEIIVARSIRGLVFEIVKKIVVVQVSTAVATAVQMHQQDAGKLLDFEREQIPGIGEHRTDLDHSNRMIASFTGHMGETQTHHCGP